MWPAKLCAHPLGAGPVFPVLLSYMTPWPISPSPLNSVCRLHDGWFNVHNRSHMTTYFCITLMYTPVLPFNKELKKNIQFANTLQSMKSCGSSLSHFPYYSYLPIYPSIPPLHSLSAPSTFIMLPQCVNVPKSVIGYINNAQQCIQYSFVSSCKLLYGAIFKKFYIKWMEKCS